jgi:hypothetical protein
MNMNLKPLLFLLLISVSVLAQSEAPCPLLSAITVDGKADEWPMTWVVDDDKKFSFNVCTDDQNLYVRVKSSDFYAKRKMGAFGFTLWFDPAGKKKRKYGLKFPYGGTEAQERIDALQAEGDPGPSSGDRVEFQRKADRIMVNNLELMELIGLADDPLTSTRSGITNGIKVAIDLDADGAYVYEALIPFKAYRLSKASLKELSVGFETGRYVPPKQKPTTKNAPQAGADLNPQQLSRLQGYRNQGNPDLTSATSAWTKLVFYK